MASTRIPVELRQGDGPDNGRGSLVSRWQRFLAKRLGHLPITRHFDAYTYACTRVFQRAHGVNTGTGIVDRATWSKALELGLENEE